MPQGTKQNSFKMTIDFHRLGLELLQFQLLNNTFLSPNLLPFDVHEYIPCDHIVDHMVKFGGRTCLKYEVHSNLGLSKEFLEVDDLASWPLC